MGDFVFSLEVGDFVFWVILSLGDFATLPHFLSFILWPSVRSMYSVGQKWPENVTPFFTLFPPFFQNFQVAIACSYHLQKIMQKKKIFKKD